MRRCSRYWPLIFALLPAVLLAANQTVVFTGTYSVNNVTTDADSAWLYLIYYDAIIDSSKVTADADSRWDGYYRYVQSTDNDSVAGWSGVWFFFDDNNTIQLSTPAAVSVGSDSTYALESSLFDNTTDSVMVDVSVAGTGGNLIPVTEDAVYANRADYKADVSGLSTLTTSDNIGINWGDISNVTASNNFTNTVVGLVTALQADAIESGDITATAYSRMGDTVRAALLDSIPVFLGDSLAFIHISADSIDLIMDTLANQSWASVGGGSDSATMIRWMNFANWGIVGDEDSSSHTQRYTAGGGCSGDGAYSCTLTVVDTAASEVVQNAAVSLNNQTEDGTVIGPLLSDASGHVVFSLDNDNYRASTFAPPGTFGTLDFTISSAAYHDTVEGYFPTIGTPSAASICSVYAWVQDPRGQKVAGATVTATLISSVDTTIDGNMLVIDDKPAKTQSDATGYWSLGLIKNSVVDTLSAYRFEIDRGGGATQSYEVYVPDSSTVQLRDLIRSFRRNK